MCFRTQLHKRAHNHRYFSICVKIVQLKETGLCVGRSDIIRKEGTPSSEIPRGCAVAFTRSRPVNSQRFAPEVQEAFRAVPSERFGVTSGLASVCSSGHAPGISRDLSRTIGKFSVCSRWFRKVLGNPLGRPSVLAQERSWNVLGVLVDLHGGSRQAC